MPLFAFYGKDGARGAELRDAHRPQHLANMAHLDQAGVLVFAGPLKDAAGTSIGSLIVFEAEDEAAARARIEADPYTRAGVFECYELLATRKAFPR